MEGGLVAELVELVEEAAGLSCPALGVEAFGVVVAAEVVVGDVAAEHGPDGDQDGVADRDEGAFLAAS